MSKYLIEIYIPIMIFLFTTFCNNQCYAQEEYHLFNTTYDEVLEVTGRSPDRTFIYAGVTNMIYHFKKGNNSNTTTYKINPYTNVVKEINVSYDRITTFEKQKQIIKKVAKALEEYGFKYLRALETPYREVYENGLVTAVMEIHYAGDSHANFDDYSLLIKYFPYISLGTR